MFFVPFFSCLFSLVRVFCLVPQVETKDKLFFPFINHKENIRISLSLSLSLSLSVNVVQSVQLSSEFVIVIFIIIYHYLLYITSICPDEQFLF